MGDARRGQGEAFRQSLEHVPAHVSALLASPPEAGKPDAPYRLPEPAQRPVVVGHAIVAVVAAQNAGIPAMLFGQPRMHEPPRLLAQRRQLARQAPALRLVLHDQPAIPPPPAVMGPTQEGGGLPSP